MSKTTLKIIAQMKEKPYYQQLKKKKISLEVEKFLSNTAEPENNAEKRIIKQEIKFIEEKINSDMDRVIEKYVDNEIKALHSIYLHRCLTYKQLYKMHFLKNFESVQEFELYILNDWIKLGIVKKLYFKHNNYVLFLTTRGVDILVTELNFEPNVVNDKKQVIKRGYFRANELEMNPRLINHQVHLNQFVLDFKRISKNIDKQYNSNIFQSLTYYDEKHLSSKKSIRPDGLISIFNTDFFLEMDMSTENRTQLIDKWNNYRSFLSSRSSSPDDSNKIVVLFIIENSKDLEQRISLVKETFTQTLIDKVDPTDFELYIGSSKQILQIAFNKIISYIENQSSYKHKLLNYFAKEDFLISYGYNVKKYFENIEYDYYIRMLNQDGSLKICEDTPIEFLVCDYRDNPVSVLNKISYHKRNSAIFKSSFGREIPLLIIVNSEKEILKDLKLINFDFDRNDKIFFINNHNLNDSIQNGIYQLDSYGNVSKFKSYSIKSKYHSHNINNI